MPDALRAALERRLERLWYGEASGDGPSVGPGAACGSPPGSAPGLADTLLLALFSPLATLVERGARRRRAAIERLPRPTRPAVVVVGNLVAGGTGKTPATIELARTLAARGWRVGIVARGYRARRDDARLVGADADAAEHGDEPVLLARATGLPVAAGRRRGDALALLAATHPALDVVLSDDGLQHASLPRTLEIAVFDARGAGNGRLLPAGPLREPLARARSLDALLLVGTDRRPCDTPAPAFRVDLHPARWRAVTGERAMTCEAFSEFARGQTAVALAGIARPGRFFDTLAALAISARALPLADHARLDAALLAGLDARLVLMTDKDAVKCRAFADERCWALELAARIDPAFVVWLEERLRGQPPA